MTGRLDRREVALDALTNGIAPFVLSENCDETWLNQYPGGFGPMPPIEDENVLKVCIDRIVEHGRALLDDQFRAFCEAIHAWQDHSAMDYALQLPPDLVVGKFMQDFPAATAVLSAVAAYAGLPLFEFLGAGRGEHITTDLR